MPADHRRRFVIADAAYFRVALSPRFPERAWDICIQNAERLLAAGPL
jgi:hypothetical protein